MKFRSCTKCENGYIYSKDENGNSIVTKCDCLKKFQEKGKVSYRLTKAEIPLSILQYKIETYIGPDKPKNIEKLNKYICNFEEVFKNKVLYFYGAKGTQKTTLSFWVAREIIKQGYSVQYVIMKDLINALTQESFEKEKYDIQKYYDCDLLIIDRCFSKEQNTVYGSGYQIPFIDNFLRKRIDQLEKACILISNESVHDIKKIFNEDIQDLIIRKVMPYNTILYFYDHYSLKNDFDKIDLWS